MRRTIGAIGIIAAIGLGGPASAAEVRVLTVGSTAVAAKAIAADFSKASGHSVAFTVTAPFKVDSELAAKPFDLLIVAAPHMETLAAAGTVSKESRTAIARVGVGLVVKAGTAMPDISTADKFKATLLAAKSLTYSDPAIPNLAGGVATMVLTKAGILDATKPKTKLADLGPAPS
jgi:molybdate transport system substrate-binding protein